MRTSNSHLRVFNGPRRQRGMVAMIIAIIVLVSTLLAVIGLMRSVDTSNLIAGTMSFRQGVVQEAERAYSIAVANIPPPCGIGTESDQPAVGYYASVRPADATRTDLPGPLMGAPPAGAISLPTGTTGNTVYYMVERLCRVSGVASKNNCVVPTAYITGGTNDESSSVIPGICRKAQSAYRLTVRVDGPKNTQAFVQTIIR